MEQPFASVHRSLLDVPVVIVAIASIGEVACEHLSVADADVCPSLAYFHETGGEVSLGPTLGSATVTLPAPVVVAGEQQLAARELSDEGEGLIDATKRDVT